MLTRRALLSLAPALISSGGQTLVFYGDAERKVTKAHSVWFTHARRDLTASAEHLDCPVYIPAAEASRFEKPLEEWEQIFTKTRLHDYANQTTRFPVRALKNTIQVQPGQKFQFDECSVEVIPTPGFTRGAVSYAIRSKGELQIATGDLIYEGGRILDLYSLQDAMPELRVRGYHGFAARIGEMIQSLRRVAALKPAKLIPAHGPEIRNPEADIARLIERLEALYSNYLYTDAYRWYFGLENFKARARKVIGQENPKSIGFSEAIQQVPPPWLRTVANSKLVVSKSGEALLMDCGSKRVMDQVRQWRSDGVFQKLRAIYVSHYHDDHTDFVQTAAEEFGAEVWATAEQEDILKRPERYRMPCLTPNPIPSLKPWRDLETREWHEFRLQNFYFPGQTIFHGALLASPKSGAEPPVLFVGDSLTPSGIDDYCLLNRNLLGDRRGFLYCLGILKSLPNALLTNQHVDPLFRFSVEQLDEIERSLKARVSILSSLFPWDNPNYGLDEQWLRLAPYVQEFAPGKTVEIEATVFNHSTKAQAFEVELHGPEGWRMQGSRRVARVGPDAESTVKFLADAPEGVTGVQVLTASVRFGTFVFPHQAEALVKMKA